MHDIPSTESVVPGRRVRTTRRLLSVLLMTIALLAPATAAHADVVVAPGKSGSICSSYSFIRTNPNVYWQTCAWADNNEVYFTVHFGNTSIYTQYVDEVHLSYFLSGEYKYCQQSTYYGYEIPSGLSNTATFRCYEVRNRSRGYAHQAYAFVRKDSLGYLESRTTDSLQAQA